MQGEVIITVAELKSGGSMANGESHANQKIAKIFVDDSGKSKLIKPGNPSVYLLTATGTSASADLRWFEINQPGENSLRDHKVIILMGATGSGKSTLIDGMFNYILGVQWKDPYRFKCVREDESESRNQAHSQTSSVTAYTLHHREGMAVPYSITLIDTPGYGDTRGVARDKEITQLIHRFLMEEDARIDKIHAACFVGASSNSRLTVTQRYILNSVLSIFGKDFKENIRLLVTFADNATPPVIEACRVANFPVTSQSAGITYSKFNSSVLYAVNEDNNFSFDELFWDMGQENFAKFFKMLEGMNGKDLKSTRQVIQHRKQLEQTLKQTELELENYFVEIEMLNRRMGQRGSADKSNQLKAKMLNLLNQLAGNIRSLESSALHWNGFNPSDYLSLMMSRVAEEQKPGYEIRLETLTELQQLIIKQEDLPVAAETTVRENSWFCAVLTLVILIVGLIIVAAGYAVVLQVQNSLKFEFSEPMFDEYSNHGEGIYCCSAYNSPNVYNNSDLQNCPPQTAQIENNSVNTTHNVPLQIGFI